MTATLEISPEERDTLHRLLCRRLFILGQDPPELARKEGVSLEQLADEFGEDLRLMEAIGWEVESERAPVALTMPAESLARTLKRLRRDARRAPCEERHLLEPKETDDARWQRFRHFVNVCEALLERLDPPDRDENERSSDAGCPLTAANPEPDDCPRPIPGQHTTSASDQTGAGEQGGPA